MFDVDDVILDRLQLLKLMSTENGLYDDGMVQAHLQ